MSHRVIETSTATVRMLDEDTILLKFKKNVTLDLDHLHENREAIFKLIGNTHVYILSIPQSDTLMSKEFRDAFSDNTLRSFKKAEAVVINTLAQQLLSNHVQLTRQTNYPLKFFTEETSAKHWLHELKKKEPNCK